MYGGQERCKQHFGGEVDCLEDLGVYGRIILKCMLKKRNEKAQTGLLQLKIRTGGGHL